MGSREKLQADFDLEHFIDMFDEALTSNDERVVNALRSLMMMVILTKPEGRKDVTVGPLRQLFDDMSNLHRRINNVEDRMRRADEQTRSQYNVWPEDKYKWAQTYANSLDQTDYNLLPQAIKNFNSPKGK